MKTLLAALAGVLTISLPALGASDIYRCAVAGGGITYQQLPCPDRSVEERANVPTEFPEINREERDRLFAREADLYKRLEARRDREMQESVLRDAAAERELERRRIDAIAQQDQQQYVVGSLYGNPRGGYGYGYGPRPAKPPKPRPLQ